MRRGRGMPAMYVSPAQTFRPMPQWCVAKPAPYPHYVIPKSHLLDPPYSHLNNPVPPWWEGRWPFPRLPWCFESETRARGTGLLTPSRSPPPALPPCRPLYWPTGNRGC